MNEYLAVLKKCNIFSGLSDEEILSSLSCLGAKPRTYAKGATIFSEGDTSKFIGIILSGEVEVQKMDYDGNSNMISKLSAGGVVAAAACYSSDKKLPFDLIFASGGKLLCLDTPSLIRPCHKGCSVHIRIIENLLSTIADSNIRLTNKINILTKRSIREKLLAYLYAESKKSKSERFEVSLSRQQMADYLSVDRSALSRELGNMKDEGLLDFDSKVFWFKK